MNDKIVAVERASKGVTVVGNTLWRLVFEDGKQR